MGYLLLKVAVKVIRQRYRDRLKLPKLVERWIREQLILVECVEKNDGAWEANNRRNSTEIYYKFVYVNKRWIKFTGFNFPVYCDLDRYYWYDTGPLEMCESGLEFIQAILYIGGKYFYTLNCALHSKKEYPYAVILIMFS